MSEANPQPMSDAVPPSQSPLSSITSSPTVASMKSGWSAMPQKTKLIVGGAVAVFVIVAGIVGLSILGAVASSVFGGGIESQVSSKGGPVELLMLKGIDDLKVTKEGRSELRMRFDFASVNGNMCGACQFTVTMADKDGDPIHYFTTQPVHQIWQDWSEVDPRKVDLSYQINPGILKRTKYVEVGIEYP